MGRVVASPAAMEPHRLRSRLSRVASAAVIVHACLAALGVAASATGTERPERVLVLDPGDGGTPRTGWWRPRQMPDPARLTHVRTRPEGAELELVLIRDEVGRARRWQTSPVTVQLPSRRDGDVLLVRARLAGHRTREVSIHAFEVPDQLEIALEPLPNTLRAATHIDLVGRRLLFLWTDEPAQVRFRSGEAAAHLVLGETRNGVAEVPGVRFDAVGEDLFIEVPLRAGWEQRSELRAHQDADRARGLERTVVEWVPRDGGLAAIDRARTGLGRLGPVHADACAQAFDRALREEIPEESLARALAPTGRFVDAVHAAALRRLATVTPAPPLELLDGTRLDPARPVEADHALGRLAEVRGYLAWLRSFVSEVAPADEASPTLAALVAPALSPADWQTALGRATAAEAGCRAVRPDVGATLR